MHVQNRLADVALCHLSSRQACSEGDVIIGVSGRPRAQKPINPDQDENTWPTGYWQALRDRGARVLVWALVVRNVMDVADYHTKYGSEASSAHRRTTIFQVDDDGELVIRAHDRVPLGGLND